MITVDMKHARAANTPICVQTLERENARLSHFAQSAKNRINNQRKWDVAKKYTNEYEFIFSFNNEGVANVAPLSRSFFKIVEIVHEHRLLDDVRGESVKFANLCEGPGGFIQGLQLMCEQVKLSADAFHAITLISDDKAVPNWKIASDSTVHLHAGEDGTGDIYKLENIDHFVRAVGENTCHIVTADGGFDFSSDFNSQENNFVRLLMCEVYAALRVQKDGGALVIKIFDLFGKSTINLVALLCTLYQNTTMYKPYTSRPANSERYLICQGYTRPPPSRMQEIREAVHNERVSFVSEEEYAQTLAPIVAINKKCVELQVDYIERTLRFIRESKPFDKRRYESYCVEWCRKYGIPIKEKKSPRG